MRLRLASVLVLLPMSFLTPVAHAATDSYFDEAVQSLQDSAVYVAPNTEGTDSDTAGIIEQQMFNGDNVVVIMLPEAAREEVGVNLVSFAKRIDEAIGGNHVIGLSVGSDVVAYSSGMPAGTPADLMDRAVSVSTNTSETLITFVRNVHKWQQQHPTASVSQPPNESADFPWLPVGGGGVALAVIAALIAKTFKQSKQRHAEERIKLNSPDEVSGKLKTLLDFRDQIEDASLRSTITQLVKDVEAYFKRNVSRADRSNAVSNFKRSLGDLESVLRKYIDVQDNPRFFKTPAQFLEQGREATEGFAEFVLQSIQQGERPELTQYNVSTDILSAQRYR